MGGVKRKEVGGREEERDIGMRVGAGDRDEV